MPDDILGALDAIPLPQVPAAIARLAARAMLRPETAPDELLTPDEAAALLRADRRWVYRHAGELGAVRLSRRKLRLSRRAIARYLERRRR